MTELKRHYQIGYIAIFLFIIYLVPVVQTVYEFAKAEDHRIQVLDLIEDLFITPVTRAQKQVVLIDGVGESVNGLSVELRNAVAILGDSTTTWSSEKAVEACDEALIKLNTLRKSIVNYNRYIELEQGGGNTFARIDTVAPLYMLLSKVKLALDSTVADINAGVDVAHINKRIPRIQEEIASAQKLVIGRRGIADYPSLVLTAFSRILVGAEYLRPYEKEIEETSIFANAVRPGYLLTYYTLFNYIGDKGVMGRNGWFFYRPDVEYVTKNYVFDHRSKIVDATDRPIKEDIIDSIVSFKNQLAVRGIDLLLVIMPGKPSIYPDMLNKGMKASSAGTFSHSLQMLEDLHKAGIETVDLFSAFARERTFDAEAKDSIYLHTDTHFRSRGVTATAHAIAERIKQYSWYTPGTTEFAVDTLTIERFGDIADMTKLPGMKIRGLAMSFPPESTICYQVSKIQRDDSGAIVSKSLYKDDFRNSDILVLGDSFSRIYQTDEPKSAGWISHLSRELSQPVASLVSNGGASTIVRENLARKPKLLKQKKLVVWEIVERDFRFGDAGWKDVHIGM